MRFNSPATWQAGGVVCVQVCALAGSSWPLPINAACVQLVEAAISNVRHAVTHARLLLLHPQARCCVRRRRRGTPRMRCSAPPMMRITWSTGSRQTCGSHTGGRTGVGLCRRQGALQRRTLWQACRLLHASSSRHILPCSCGLSAAFPPSTWWARSGMWGWAWPTHRSWCSSTPRAAGAWGPACSPCCSARWARRKW